MNKINISNFFTRQNEEDGIERKLYVDGEFTGLIAVVYGANSNAVSIANETYRREIAEINTIKDPMTKAEKSDVAFSKRMAGFVKNIYAEDGSEIVKEDGTPITKDDYAMIMKESPLIARAVLEIASDTENFLDKKKNA